MDNPQMVQTEFDPIEYINTPRWRDSSLGLDRITALMDALGRPQDALRFVHVAGTNGKGSVCAYSASILKAAGYRTGLFTSPFVERFEERIQINGENIPFEELRRVTLKVRDAAESVEAECGEHPTEFELMCAVALVYFKESKCDIVVMEVGLGGRLDATNVITPDVSIIARIGFDHTALLGDTLTAITIEKSGIVKQGVPVVTYPQEQEAMRVLEDICEGRGCELTWPIFSQISMDTVDYAEGVRTFSYRGVEYTTSLLGSYQPENATVAIEGIRALQRFGWKIDEESLRKGIEQAIWPGRFEVLRRRPLLIVDGAHNPQGASALADSLSELLASMGESHIEREVFFVMGVLSDKDYEYMIAPLIPYARGFVTYPPNNSRALSAEDLKKAVERQVSEDIEVIAVKSAAEAIEFACAAAGDSGIVVAFGSLYSVGEIKRCATECGASR